LIDLDRLRSALPPHYKIEGEIAAGGMAHVYLANDQKHERQVAIKVLRPDLASLLGPERFLREIRIEARLQHPNILPLHDSGESDGFLYYVMPYVAGESLRDRLEREKQLTLEEALHIIYQLADALSYAHSQGVVHRDIKPENILLHSGHALLADFGIARAIGDAGGDRVTETGHSVGTPAYMSPEQAAGECDLDGRSDIYSLGCVLYEMLAGDPPFAGRTARAVIAKQIAEPPPSLQVVRPSTPSHVIAAIEKALAKIPAERFGLASEFKERLQTPYAREPSVSRRPVSDFGSRLRRWVSTRTLALGSVFAAAVLIGGFLRLLSVVGPDHRTPLEPNRIVVFPLVVSGDMQGHSRLGEDIATVCIHALGGTSPLRWLDGWLWLERTTREDVRLLSAEDAEMIARQHGARYYIWGRSVVVGDSVQVLLRAHDLEGDSVVGLAESAGFARQAWRPGLQAFTGLLPSLIPVGGQVPNLTALSDTPAAVTNFLIGERHYRRSQFPSALERYKLAVRADSSFAVAALRGAQAACWNYHWAIDPAVEQLLAIAIRNSASLPLHHAHFALGLQHQIQGRADSALSYMARAVAADTSSRDAWMSLARTYRFLLPKVSPLDSLAYAAYSKVVELDPEFTPAFVMLLYYLARNEEVDRAAPLLQQLRAAQPDVPGLDPVLTVELMLACVQKSQSELDWRSAARTTPSEVFQAARSLVVGAAKPDCARAAWTALLDEDTASEAWATNRRFNAFFGLQSLLVAEGRYEELARLYENYQEFREYEGHYAILAVVAGAPLQEPAAARAGILRERYKAGSAHDIDLWFLGIWEAHQGNAEVAMEVYESLNALATTSGNRRARLLANSIQAHATLASGDSARAVALFQRLAPTATGAELAWYPWESLGPARLALTKLLITQGEYEQAARVASNFDAPAAAVPYLIYLPQSLALRVDVARKLGDAPLERRFRQRLIALGRNDLSESSPPFR